MSAPVERSESVDNICPVCHDVIEIFAIGPCDHPVCSRCSTRMRVLCEQMDCPICRSQMPQVAFVYNKSPFKDINLRDCIPNRKYKIFFEDKDVEDSFLDLLEYRCKMPSCQNRNPDRSFAQLQTHMRREHQLFACDLCVSHLKIFPFERKFYNRKNLAIHRRVGDADDKSYKGHPLCEFCDARYNDKDELLKHLRKDHFFCHFCDQQGSNAYYDQYADLVKHFSESHFLCTEGECGNPATRFTHAFISDIDLKAHKASVHNKNLSKAQSREVRTIEVDFQLSRRRPGSNRTDEFEDTRSAQSGRGKGHDRFNRRRDYDAENADFHRAVEASLESARSETASVHEERVPDPVADFPALSGAVVPVSFQAMQKPASKPEEDFPKLSATRDNKQPPQPSLRAYSSVMNPPVDPKPVTVAVKKESKPVSLGPVIKNYREFSFSAPKNTEDEYPTLSGNTSNSRSFVPAASTTTSSNWVTKTQASSVAVVPASMTNKNIHEKPNKTQKLDTILRDDSQFPKLGGGNKQKSIAGFSANTSDGSKQNGGGGKKKQKEGKHYDENFELPDSYRSVEEHSPIEKTVKTVDSLPGRFVSPTVIHSKVAPVNNTDEFPGLPARTSKVKAKEDKKKLPRKEEKVKTKGAEDLNACLSEIASALMHRDEKSSSSGSGSKETKSSKKELKPLDWFDNPPDLSVDSQPVNKEPNDVTVVTKNESPALLSNSSDFPSLHSMTISIQQPKPPPGFKPYAQPPGLTSLPAPPGFDKKSEPAASIPATSPVTSIPSTPPGFSQHMVYIQPTDFKSRNLKLIEAIREALVDVEEGFTNFKVLSSQFRQSIIDANNYYTSCQALMGRQKFTQVFPELLALLPDITKQRELWQIHQALTSNNTSVGSCRLSDCHICGQVLVAEDIYHHQMQHTGLSEFPLLNDSSRMSGNVVGSDMQVKESWIKAK